MAASGRTTLLDAMSDIGMPPGRDWPDHQGFRALHYAACHAGTDDEAGPLVKALVRRGASLHPDVGSEDNLRLHLYGILYGTGDDGHTNDSRGVEQLLGPDSVIPNRPWLRTDRLMPSGAVVHLDPDMLEGLDPVPFEKFAGEMERPALAQALRAAGAN